MFQARRVNSGKMEGVRSLHAYSSGIHFFEVSWDPSSKGNVVIGLATSETDLTGNNKIQSNYS